LVQIHYASKGLATIPIIMRRPLLVTTMGSDIMPGMGYRFPYRFWINLVLAHADRITTRSNFMKDRLIAMGVPGEKIEVISWGIDLDHFARQPRRPALKEKWGAPKDAFVFLDPRSATPLYNKDIIIQAFAQFSREEQTDAVLLVAGVFAQPDELASLKALAADSGVADKVIFIGNVAYEDMPELYSLAEVTVSVPSSDGMPQTIFEAWGCGSFLIVGDLPQYDEFIAEDQTGRRVPLRDVPALAEAMRWIVQHPEVREAAIEQGRAKARHFADRRQQRAKLRSLVEEMLADKALRAGA
ncbi:MAG: glycosyltransferase family 4 protein, partial [Thiotrichales bacterium]|nr:glycosyltransferase family 4 protein [Thiotrichales bacterium]